MSSVDFLETVITDDGIVATGTLAKVLHITKSDLAKATGLSRDAVSKTSRLKSKTTQARLRDTVGIINRVSAWSGGVGRTFAWFRSQPLLSFGDKTAEDLVKEGRVKDVKAYLSRIALYLARPDHRLDGGAAGISFQTATDDAGRLRSRLRRPRLIKFKR